MFFVSGTMWVLTEISECCSPTTIIATNTLRLDVSAVAYLVTQKEVCCQSFSSVLSQHGNYNPFNSPVLVFSEAQSC